MLKGVLKVLNSSQVRANSALIFYTVSIPNFILLGKVKYWVTVYWHFINHKAKGTWQGFYGPDFNLKVRIENLLIERLICVARVIDWVSRDDWNFSTRVYAQNSFRASAADRSSNILCIYILMLLYDVTFQTFSVWKLISGWTNQHTERSKKMIEIKTSTSSCHRRD